MRWLLYGESWRGAMPYSAKQALKALGHETVVFDPSHYYFHNRIHNKLGIALDRLGARYIARVINRCLQSVLRNNKFDIVLVFKGFHIWPETVRLARQRCKWVVNWNWDDFFNKVRYHRSPYIEDSFNEYALILTPRYHLIRDYLARGAQRVERLDFCYDPSVHYPIEGRNSNYDISFVGTWSARREQIVSGLAQFAVLIAGASWKRAARSVRDSSNLCFYGGAALCEEMSRLLNNAKIGLNVLTLENRDWINLRNYEIPACGAFQLCERSEAVSEVFSEGKDIECYGCIEELIEKALYYRANVQKREAVQRAGFERVTAGGHTYVDRMNQLVMLLKEG